MKYLTFWVAFSIFSTTGQFFTPLVKQQKNPQKISRTLILQFFKTNTWKKFKRKVPVIHQREYRVTFPYFTHLKNKTFYTAITYHYASNMFVHWMIDIPKKKISFWIPGPSVSKLSKFEKRYVTLMLAKTDWFVQQVGTSDKGLRIVGKVKQFSHRSLYFKHRVVSVKVSRCILFRCFQYFKHKKIIVDLTTKRVFTLEKI